MKKWIVFAALLGCLTAAVAGAAGPTPGAELQILRGRRRDGRHRRLPHRFSRLPVSRTDSRQLNLAYSPDQRQLIITVTQKGLNRLQDWLNGATDTGTPVSKTVAIEARDNQDTLLARWELSSVTPSTFSSAAAGNINEIDSTVEFFFDRLRLVQANGK